MKIILMSEKKYYISSSPEDDLIILNLDNPLIFKSEGELHLRALVNYTIDDISGDKLYSLLLLTKQTTGIYKHFNNLKITTFNIHNINEYKI